MKSKSLVQNIVNPEKKIGKQYTSELNTPPGEELIMSTATDYYILPSASELVYPVL